jgi:predicted RecA/RadA family phage recombinase
MANNFICSGDVIDYQNGGTALASGAGVKIGLRIGIALAAIAANATGSVQMEGVFKVTKAASQAWTQGALVYWDDTAKNFTTTSAGNTLAGYAWEPAVSGAQEVTGYVKLNA